MIGTNTDFILDLLINKYILIVNTVPNQPPQLYRYKIVSIISGTELELDSPVVQISDATMYRGWIQSDFVRNAGGRSGHRCGSRPEFVVTRR